jgi:hypothetical protein
MEKLNNMLEHMDNMEKIWRRYMVKIWGRVGNHPGFTLSGTFLGAATLNALQCHQTWLAAASWKITKHGGLNGTIIELIISWWILKSSCRDHPVLEFNLSSIQVTSLEPHGHPLRWFHP